MSQMKAEGRSHDGNDGERRGMTAIVPVIFICAVVKKAFEKPSLRDACFPIQPTPPGRAMIPRSRHCRSAARLTAALTPWPRHRQDEPVLARAFPGVDIHLSRILPAIGSVRSLDAPVVAEEGLRKRA